MISTTALCCFILLSEDVIQCHSVCWQLKSLSNFLSQLIIKYCSCVGAIKSEDTSVWKSWHYIHRYYFYIVYFMFKISYFCIYDCARYFKRLTNIWVLIKKVSFKKNVVFPKSLILYSLSLEFIFIHMSNRWIYVISHVRQASSLSIWLAILHGKTFSIGHYTETFQPNSSIPATLTGTIDFYHFIPLPVTWLWLGVTRSVEIKSVGYIVLRSFQRKEMR